MFFASRYAPPLVSEELQPGADALAQGRYADAWHLLEQASRDRLSVLPCNALLAAEAARALGLERRYRAVVRWARKRWPDNPYVLLEWLRQAVRRDIAPALVQLTGLLAARRVPEAAHALAEAIMLSAQLRGLTPVPAAQRLPSPHHLMFERDPRVAYTLGHAWANQREWERGAAALRRAVDLAPRWHRARASLAHVLMSAGLYEQARESVKAEGGDEPYDYLRLCLELSLNNLHAASRIGLEYTARWSGGDTREKVQDWLLFTASLLRDAHLLVALLTPTLGPDGALTECERLLACPRVLLALPPLSQVRHQCVPTAAAMVAAWHGDPLEPQALFAALGGGPGGVDMARLRDYFTARAYRVEFVSMRPAVLQALLSAGLPVIGLVDGPFFSHVDVVCGYDAGHGVYYRRDPERWALQWSSEADLARRYGPGGDVGMVLVPPGHDDFDFDPAWRNIDATVLDGLKRACARGDVASATAWHAQLGDDSPLVLQRAQVAQGIVESPRDFGSALLRIVSTPNLPALVRWRALVMIDDPAILRRYKREVLAGMHGRDAARYVDGVEMLAQRRWQEACAVLEPLALRYRSHGALWLRLAQAQAPLGLTDAAWRSATRALVPNPHAPAVVQHVAEMFPDLYGRAERLRRWRMLRRHAPRSYETVMAEADAREYGRQGPGYQRALLRCIAWEPMQMRHYERLAQWYLAQGLAEQARAVLERARQRLTPTSDQAPPLAPANMAALSRARLDALVRSMRSPGRAPRRGWR
ncbi:hypothetical protein [Bordetella sp. N]|uniref:hypothetical protein n=1 Tax=Bordetella sp. N TaxID=1746199 RepID=UPI00070FFE7A|nr:hypothetical protein [Bordetella sp. N]ALM85862.1 hypothetical protein ASB57_25535 [Bordetella sp. N]